MGIGKFLGFGDTKDAVTAIGGIVDDLWTSGEEKMSHAEVMAKIALNRDSIQTAINQVEAQHRSLFVAGWRPFIGWVCGVALAWHYIGYSLCTWAIATLQLDVTAPELVGTESLMELVFAMLGMAGLRSWEKLNGRAK